MCLFQYTHPHHLCVITCLLKETHYFCCCSSFTYHFLDKWPPAFVGAFLYLKVRYHSTFIKYPCIFSRLRSSFRFPPWSGRTPYTCRCGRCAECIYTYAYRWEYPGTPLCRCRPGSPSVPASCLSYSWCCHPPGWGYCGLSASV